MYETPSSFCVASRHRASYFTVGDVILYGKYKNKIVAGYLDANGSFYRSRCYQPRPRDTSDGRRAKKVDVAGSV